MEITIYREVIIEERPDYIMIRCGRCKATGTRDRDGREPKCSVCGGAGKILLRIPPDRNSLVRCGFCKGDGTRDRDGRDPVCPVCKGVGAVFTELPAVVCSRCNGTGSRDKDGRPPLCKVCGGTGIVPLSELRVH